MAYVTLSDLKLYLDIDSNADDTMLADLAAKAQRIFERRSGRVFAAASDTTRTLDAIEDVHGAVLWLGRDICQITTVTNGDGVAVASDEYTTQPRNETPYYAIKLLSSAGKVWTYDGDPEDAISVTGRWAYSVTPPDDVVFAVLRLAGWLYRQRDSGKEYDRAIIAGNTTILPADFPNDVIRLADSYRAYV